MEKFPHGSWLDLHKVSPRLPIPASPVLVKCDRILRYEADAACRCRIDAKCGETFARTAGRSKSGGV